jgi:hypothetical protein
MMTESWIDPTGDDLFLIHAEGRLLPSRPLGFGGPRYLYEHLGAVLEITPTVHQGLSAWKITRRSVS